jgi:O-antigen ligase
VNERKTTVSRIAIIISSLIFISILAYGGAEVWLEAAILATILSLAAESLFRKHHPVESEIKRLLAPFLALAGYSFIQGLFTLSSLSGKLKYSHLLPYSFDLTASFWCSLKFAGLALFIRLLLTNFRANIRVLIWGLIIIGNFFAILGIVRFWLQTGFPETFGWFILPELRPGVGFGTFLNQNHYAFLMLMNLGLSTGLCAYGKLEKNKRLILLLFTFLTWIAIILTASRGGIISSFLVIFVSLFLPRTVYFRQHSKYSNKNSRFETLSTGRTLAGLLAMAVLGAAGIVLIGQDRVIQRFEEIPAHLKSAPQVDAYSRPDVWRASAAMIEDNIFFGVGFGGFRYAVSQYIEISGEVVPQQAHNDYLEFAASGGLLGVLLGIWFLYNLLSILKKRFSEPVARFEDAARFGAVGAFVGIAVHNFFDFGLQFIANLLFLAALLSISVYKKEANESKTTKHDSSIFLKDGFAKLRAIYAVCLLILSFICLFFGFSRLESSLARIDTDLSDIQNNIIKLPFDADFYQTGALLGEKAGNLEIISENLTQAIYYRPKDYVLWLKLGKTRELQGQNEAAESAFRQTLELAPFYGEPFYDYGNFLIRNNRKAEGFEQLHSAFKRNYRYFGKVYGLARRETGENAEQTIKLLSPLDLPEKESLAELLLAQTDYASIPGIACREEDLTALKRSELIVKLLEKRQFLYAYQIYTRNCYLVDKNNLLDGDFETGQLENNLGFGWRRGNLPETVKIGFDNQTYLSGNHSLGLVFNGVCEPSLPLIAQTLVVEKNHYYRLTFVYRTDKITGGSPPVLQLILKQAGNDEMFKEIKLAENSGDWVKYSIPIETDNQVEALEIRLARQNCKESLCPIFGRLWLDNFTLQ